MHVLKLGTQRLRGMNSNPSFTRGSKSGSRSWNLWLEPSCRPQRLVFLKGPASGVIDGEHLSEDLQIGLAEGQMWAWGPAKPRPSEMSTLKASLRFWGNVTWPLGKLLSLATGDSVTAESSWLLFGMPPKTSKVPARCQVVPAWEKTKNASHYQVLARGLGCLNEAMA